MAQVENFKDNCIDANRTLFDVVERIRVLKQRLTDDSALFETAPESRSDLTTFDMSAWSDAMANLIATYDTAPNRARIEKLL